MRPETLRAIFMDLGAEFGEQGFRWIFLIHMHGAPDHNQALDDAGEYFRDALRLLDGEADERKTARLAALMENPDVAKLLERSKQRDAAIAKRQQEWIAAQRRP